MTAPWQAALGDQRLLLSGFGRWGGGIYDVTSGEPAALDNVPTSGLTLGGGRLWRALRAPGEQTAACELLSYDDRGLRSYERSDVIRDPHDICWHDGALHVASSWDSIVWRVEPGREPTVAWRGGAVPDSWHVNSLVEVDGRLHICAFGRFTTHKAWRTDDDATAGFVHDTARGVDVLCGLAHPHHPRWTGESWLVCESTPGTLTEVTPDGQVVRRLGIGRFCRGLALAGPWAFVGGNAHRDDEDDRAEVVVVDLRRLTVVDRIALPCLEIYDILPVPRHLARGVAIGLGANAARAVEQQRSTARGDARASTPREARLHLVGTRTAEALAAAGRPLEVREARRLGVHLADADADTDAATDTTTHELHAFAAGEMRSVRVTVENRSRLTLVTVPPHPIRVGSRWLPIDAPDAEAAAPKPVTPRPMSALPQLVHPGAQVDVDVLLVAPDEPGRYEVRIALHQKGLGWFGRRARLEAEVTPGLELAAVSPADR
jgi:hypothetical protein